MILHVKVGTLPAYYAEIVRKKKPPKVGECLQLKSELKNGEPIWVRCALIKDLGDGYLLYFMERR
jgi:hypothetical protein